ncbi:hypothetical protein R1flu_012562 [Riccia fluitans]|uniref:Uncharacterized protein n=1 Tax=Riccia fluitans TaxID=41844 RepID=A0ABD1ZC01_9MARC
MAISVGTDKAHNEKAQEGERFGTTGCPNSAGEGRKGQNQRTGGPFRIKPRRACAGHEHSEKTGAFGGLYMPKEMRDSMALGWRCAYKVFFLHDLNQSLLGKPLLHSKMTTEESKPPKKVF